MSTNRLRRMMGHYHIKLHRDVVLGDLNQLLAAIAAACREAVVAGPLAEMPDRSAEPPGCTTLHAIASIICEVIDGDQAELLRAVETMITHSVIAERDKAIATSVRTN